MTVQPVCGVIGLGRMGSGLARLLAAGGFPPVVYDANPQAVAALVAQGIQGAEGVAHLAAALASPRTIWILVPAGPAVDQVLADLAPHLAPGDVVIDGGNSHWRDSVRRAQALAAQGVHFLDCGCSGGVEGARSGLCLMVGGDPDVYARVEPMLQAVSRPRGCRWVGPSGAGHYVKMVHNAIEYGMLQAIGEGFELLAAAPYDLDLAAIAELWNQGSVIRSWLLELAARALAADPRLEAIGGAVGGGETGLWAIQEAWERGVPLATIALAYSLRLRSRQSDTFAGKVVAALRREFGGHATQPAGTRQGGLAG